MADEATGIPTQRGGGAVGLGRCRGGSCRRVVMQGAKGRAAGQVVASDAGSGDVIVLPSFAPGTRA